MSNILELERSWSKAMILGDYPEAVRLATEMVKASDHPALDCHVSGLLKKAKRHLQKGWLSKLNWRTL